MIMRLMTIDHCMVIGLSMYDRWIEHRPLRLSVLLIYKYNVVYTTIRSKLQRVNCEKRRLDFFL